MATILTGRGDTWALFSELLAPAVHMELGRAGRFVKDAKLWTDYVEDDLLLVVTHRLCSRMEMENRMFSVIGDRLREALCVPKPDWKDLRVKRRQLHWRGRQAAQAKPRKRA